MNLIIIMFMNLFFIIIKWWLKSKLIEEGYTKLILWFIFKTLVYEI